MSLSFDQNKQIFKVVQECIIKSKQVCITLCLFKLCNHLEEEENSFIVSQMSFYCNLTHGCSE